MNNKKGVIAILVVLALVFLAACGGKYSDAIELSEKQVDAMEAYSDRLEKADSAQKVVVAVDAFAADMERLVSKVSGLRDKYPELYKEGATMPAEFARIQKKTEAVVERMSAASMKTMQYMMDPAVQKAMMNLNATMMNLKK